MRLEYLLFLYIFIFFIIFIVFIIIITGNCESNSDDGIHDIYTTKFAYRLDGVCRSLVAFSKV